jgi:hypothetical protein
MGQKRLWWPFDRHVCSTSYKLTTLVHPVSRQRWANCGNPSHLLALSEGVPAFIYLDAISAPVDNQSNLCGALPVQQTQRIFILGNLELPSSSVRIATASCPCSGSFTEYSGKTNTIATAGQPRGGGDKVLSSPGSGSIWSHGGQLARSESVLGRDTFLRRPLGRKPRSPGLNAGRRPASASAIIAARSCHQGNKGPLSGGTKHEFGRGCARCAKPMASHPSRRSAKRD